MFVRRSIVILTSILSISTGMTASCGADESAFVLGLSARGVTSLRRRTDARGVEFIRDGEAIGDVVMRYRIADGQWQKVETTNGNQAASATTPDGVHEVTCRFDGKIDIVQRFVESERTLTWSIAVHNAAAEPVEVGDLALSLPMRTSYTWNREETFERRLYRHQFISAHGSFVFWQPTRGRGPHLVMLPAGNTGLEYFTHDVADYATGGGTFLAFIHAGATEPTVKGSWRQPISTVRLAPDETARYRFTFHWADGLQGVRDALYDRGSVDVTVAPGMVVPVDHDVMLALRTRQRLAGLAAEWPDQTRVEPVPTAAADTLVHRVRFSRLGENRLDVRYADGRRMHLEFFVTEPIETLIKKRAAFIARNQQHRNPAVWYDGLFSLWDVRQPPGRNLLGPDHHGGQPAYAVSGSDDPSNSKCIYLAEKNVAYPDAAEIAALEYFIERFVWGKLQRTDQEQPYPFGIYGSDSWHQNRHTDRDPPEKQVSRPGGPSACRMWRSFDYTTYVALYFNMYRIAKQNPALVKYLDAAGYLDRASGTARGYFEVPSQIRMEGGWSHTGWVYWA